MKKAAVVVLALAMILSLCGSVCAESVYIDEVAAFFGENGVDFSVANDGTVLQVPYHGVNYDSMNVYLDFTRDNDGTVAIYAWPVENVSDRNAALVACNDFNLKYGWVSACLDTQGDIGISLYTSLSKENCGSTCLQLVDLFASIWNDACPAFTGLEG